MGRRSRNYSNSGPVGTTAEEESEEFEGYEGDPDADGLNDPDMMAIPEPPLIGGKTKNSDLFGSMAETQGRISSPKLYASSTRFPSASQFRVWRWENGVPVALGAIDCEASEDEFVQQFFDAMPKPGDGRYMFKLRPVDVRGNELGQEVTHTISEHHAVLQRIRRQKAAAAEEAGAMNGFGRGGDVHVHGGGEASNAALEEVGRLYEHAMEARDEETRRLQTQVELEREQLRVLEQQRVNERISLAEKSTNVVQAMTERLMESDRARAEEALKAQQALSNTTMSTLTTVFSQQSQAQREAAERQREIDERRALQDREFFERQRQEVEARRRLDLEESERRRREEQQNFERKQAEAEAQRKFELEQYKLRVAEDRERARAEIEERRREDERRFEQRRLDEEKKREEERREWERRESIRKDEERRYEERKREELAREEARRREEIQIQLKQLEVSAQRDREHAERMMDMARLERETQREAQERREKMEREAREQVERDRQRQYDMEMRRLEQQAQADREHAERMIAIQKAQNSGGMSGLTDLLGMETPELLARIFGAKDEDGGGWSDAIPKVLGGLAEVFSTVAKTQGVPQPPGRPQIPQQPRPQLPQGGMPLYPPPGTNYQPGGFKDGVLTEPGFVASEATPTSKSPAPVFVEEEAEETVALPGKKPAPNSDVLTKRAKDAGMKFSEQRKARRALRDLLPNLREKKEEEYIGVIVETMTRVPEIATYIKAVSVRSALEEAGAVEDEILLTLRTLRESGMLPADVPLEEADIVRIQAEAVAKEKAVEAPSDDEKKP